MLSLHDPVSKLHLVGPKNQELLKKLGLTRLEDLLFYFPRDWQDLSEIKTISQASPGEKINLRATVKKIAEKSTRWRRMYILEALLEDETGDIAAVWFNQPFLKRSLFEGREYYFSGKIQMHETLQLSNPTFEVVKADTIHTAGVIPAYELTADLTQKQLRYWLKQALAALPQIRDPLPLSLRNRLKFPDIKTAIKNIHFPENESALEKARQRLAFEELFLFQLALQSYKKKLKSLPAPKILFNQRLVKTLISSLPFKLTNSQRLAVWEILQDLSQPHPMNRLLEGEVGSGKTVVAGIAMAEVASANFQSVLLAPTEILAWQHFQTLKNLLNEKVELSLQTRSRKVGELEDIKNGTIKIIIGTHALLQESVKFRNIGLLVVDEQHRFGVKQRAELAKGQTLTVPHLLTMTATPIPRTLSLALYGDLDISLLKELPKGRKKIITRLVSLEKRGIAYEFIRKLLHAGQQVYVVTPLVEESDKLGVKSVELEAKRLKQDVFSEFGIGTLHGRMQGEEKKMIMEKFKEGKLQILVSTTVIEVGVDVPNATVMIIENAERFGLAQLHQLRGRVGRSSLQSYCLLFSENQNDLTRTRLEAVVRSNDGFELAEKDLDLRGSGEIMGTKQSGYIPFKIAKLTDRKLINTAKAEAENLLTADPNLMNAPLLKQKTEDIARGAHLE